MKLEKPILVLVNEFLAENSNLESTKDLYKKTLHLWITWMVKNDWPVSEPSRANLISYREYLRSRSLSLRTIDNYLAAVKQFTRWLYENNYIEKDIYSGLKNLRKTNEYLKAALSYEEVDRLLNVTRGESLISQRDHAIINLMIFTGMRRLEVCRCDTRDFYCIDGQWYARIHGKGHYEKDSEIPITQAIMKPILIYWKQRGVSGSSDITPAFINHARCSRGRIDPSFLSKMVKKYLRVCGLDDRKYSCHSLRHTCAVMALKSGAKVFQIQQLLRHRSPSTTELYLKAIREERVLDGAAVFAIDQYYQKRQKTD
jgi:integrase/recombinase XerC/integrase/recombinase XerD